jgi:hypothetical protein
VVNRVENRFKPPELEEGRDVRTLPSGNFNRSKTIKSIRRQVVEKEDHIEEAE